MRIKLNEVPNNGCKTGCAKGVTLHYREKNLNKHNNTLLFFYFCHNY